VINGAIEIGFGTTRDNAPEVGRTIAAKHIREALAVISLD
jgi:hypothetical protein